MGRHFWNTTVCCNLALKMGPKSGKNREKNLLFFQHSFQGSWPARSSRSPRSNSDFWWRTVLWFTAARERGNLIHIFRDPNHSSKTSSAFLPSSHGTSRMLPQTLQLVCLNGWSYSFVLFKSFLSVIPFQEAKFASILRKRPSKWSMLCLLCWKLCSMGPCCNHLPLQEHWSIF